VEYRADIALIPLFLRVAGSQAVSVHTGPSGDEDALPTVVEMANDGLLLSRGTKITEVRGETTDDA
jgi:hypothetical protein